MNELKNTPWHTVLIHWNRNLYKVVDSEGLTIVEETNKPTAKAVAALPDTLNELAELKAENERLKEGIKEAKELSNATIPSVSGCYYAENGTVYRSDDDLNTIVCFLNRNTGGYMSLPEDVAEKVAEMLNNP